MALTPGTHQLGPANGSVEIHTFRDGVAQKVGHDLIIDATDWHATVQVSEAGPQAITLEIDSRSLRVRDGVGGVKALSDKDKDEIRKSIEAKVLLGQPVSYQSDSVETSGGLTVLGQLTLVGMARPTSFELELAEDGHVTGTLSVLQSEWGIKPYKGLMGALKVRDEVEIKLDVALPTN
jgi:polyisoprenoid-binding protein YceI